MFIQRISMIFLAAQFVGEWVHVSYCKQFYCTTDGSICDGSQQRIISETPHILCSLHDYNHTTLEVMLHSISTVMLCTTLSNQILHHTHMYTCMHEHTHIHTHIDSTHNTHTQCQLGTLCSQHVCFNLCFFIITCNTVSMCTSENCGGVHTIFAGSYSLRIQLTL